MLENDMCTSGIGQASLSSYQGFKWNQGITKGESPYLKIFGNLLKYETHFTENSVISDKSQFSNIKN